MKIYIAGTFQSQKRLREPAVRLWELGHEIVGTWLNEVARPDHMSSDDFKKKLAMKDLCEVSKADILILDNLETIPSGGKNTEFGFALGAHQSKQVWLVGPPSSVFHYLADLQFEDWNECINYMKESYAIHSTGTKTPIGFLPGSSV